MNIINLATYFIFLGASISLLFSSISYLIKKFSLEGAVWDKISINLLSKLTLFFSYAIISSSFAIMLGLTSCVAVVDADEDEFWVPIFVEILLNAWGVV